MKSRVDLRMKETIENWGLPECLTNLGTEIVYKFDNEGLYDDGSVEYQCTSTNFKFCLFAPTSKTKLFTMDFFKPSTITTGKDKVLKLELMIVHDHLLRGKGIASFYLDKLIEYARAQEIDYIKVTACPDATTFKHENKLNTLTKDRLVKFYSDRSSIEMPIRVLRC